MPSSGLKIIHNSQELTLHLIFCNPVLLPVSRISLIFEHIDTRIRDVWESLMEFPDSRQSLSWLRKRKPEDEVDVERDIII